MWPQVVWMFVVCLAQITWVSGDQPIYKWDCISNRCVKTKVDPLQNERAFNLEQCKMFCEEFGVLWPRPNGRMQTGNFLSKINLNALNFNVAKHGESDHLLHAAIERFQSLLKKSIPEGVMPKFGKAVDIHLFTENPDIKDFSLDMDESYTLEVTPIENSKIVANVSGSSFFGVRHGLETLSQLFFYDDTTNYMLVSQ